MQSCGKLFKLTKTKKGGVKMPKRLDLKGHKFNMLTVLEFYDVQNGMSRWKCKCDCGKEIVAYGRNLKSGNTMSCGCYWESRKHEHGLKHGESKTRLYQIWCDMKDRCYNPNNVAYKYYGGKGVIICEEWLDYSNFSAWAKSNGYSDNLTIDRINGNKNYVADNCRWISRKANSDRSRRKYSGYAYNSVTGEKEEVTCLADFARAHNYNPHTLQCNVKKNKRYKEWQFEVSLNKISNDY